jgi:hypothetical protein
VQKNGRPASCREATRAYTWWGTSSTAEVDFFTVACRHNLEGIVAKWKDGSYQAGNGYDVLAEDQEPVVLADGRAARVVRPARGNGGGRVAAPRLQLA